MSNTKREAQLPGCLYDGSVEVQAFTKAELAEIEAATAEEGGETLAASPFRVLTNIRSQNFNLTPNRRMRPPVGIVLHHTGGSFAGDLATLTKPAANPDNSVSANDYITKDGRIFELCEYPKRAWHAGRTKAPNGWRTWNAHGWGIEIENTGKRSDPYPPAQIEAIVWRCRERRRFFRISDPKMLTRAPRHLQGGEARHLRTHFRTRKSVGGSLPSTTRPTGAVVLVVPTTDDSEITVSSPLMARPRARQRQAATFLTLRPEHGAYSPSAVRNIAALYFDEASAVGMDPLLVVAQMVLETGGLTSHWSQAPRRNPAGIGVTGEPNKGVSFPNWRSAVRAHVGRLAAYAVPEANETPAQEALINEALTWRPSCPTRSAESRPA